MVAHDDARCSFDTDYNLQQDQVATYSCRSDMGAHHSMHGETWSMSYTVTTNALVSVYFAFNSDCEGSATARPFRTQEDRQCCSDSYTSDDEFDTACIKLQCKEASCSGRFQGSIESDGMAAAAIVGMIVGAVVLVGLIMALIIVVRKRRMVSRRKAESHMGTDVYAIPTAAAAGPYDVAWDQGYAPSKPQQGAQGNPPLQPPPQAPASQDGQAVGQNQQSNEASAPAYQVPPAYKGTMGV